MELEAEHNAAVHSSKIPNLFWSFAFFFFLTELHLQTTGETDGSNKQKTAANLAFSRREQFVCRGFIFSIISISLVFCSSVVLRKICTFVILSNQFINNYHISEKEAWFDFELTENYIMMGIYIKILRREFIKNTLRWLTALFWCTRWRCFNTQFNKGLMQIR